MQSHSNKKVKKFHHSYLSTIQHHKIKNISQEKLAEMVDLSREYITRVENGQKNISLKKLFAIADALDVGFNKLTDFE